MSLRFLTFARHDIPTLVSLTQLEAHARYSGEREASDASRFPAFIHAYGQASHIINTQISHGMRNPLAFITFAPTCSENVKFGYIDMQNVFWRDPQQLQTPF